jgi:diguanylate cyclase (GGDEF)-like protein
VLGAEISFSIFYVLPISFATWYGGRGLGILLALVSAATWLWADLAAGHIYSGPLIPYWNTGVRLGYFLIISALLRVLRDRLAREATLAETDGLTGLRNSRSFVEALEVEQVRSARYGRSFTIAYLDLDGFKAVNDSLGHAAGDGLLTQVGTALRASVRRTDIVARLGGDEFAALLPETNAGAAAPVLAKIRSAIATLEGCNLGISIGAVTFNTPPESAGAALRQADDLMYQVKRTGKNAILHVEAGAPPLP